MNGVAELLEAALREIGPADAGGEKDVPAEDPGAGAVQVGDVAGRVPRNVEDLERQTGDVHPVALVQKPVGAGAGDRQTEGGAQVGVRIAEHDFVATANQDRRGGK